MYQDRSPGGGRDQIYDTINGLLTQSFVHWSQSLRTAMAALCKDGATFSITGIGGDLAQKRKLHTFSIIPSRSHPRTVQRRTVDSLRWNREDSEVLGVLVDGVLGSGEGAVLYAFDQDFINIGLVAHARAVGAGTPIAGTLFVRQKEQLVAGQPEEYANVSALYDKLESDEETNHFAGRAELQAFGRSPARGLRALFVVVASMALGRDSLSGIPGVSHEKGLLRYRDLAGWVGALVRAATDAEAEDGHEIVVDKDAMVSLLPPPVRRTKALDVLRALVGIGCGGAGARAGEAGLHRRGEDHGGSGDAEHRRPHSGACHERLIEVHYHDAHSPSH